MDELKKLKQKYDLKDGALNKVLELQSMINLEEEKISFDRLIDFLVMSMNDREMQVWRFGRSLNGEIVSLNDSLIKYFDLYGTETILNLYNESNKEIKLIRKRK